MSDDNGIDPEVKHVRTNNAPTSYVMEDDNTSITTSLMTEVRNGEPLVRIQTEFKNTGVFTYVDLSREEAFEFTMNMLRLLSIIPTKG